jgi:hypothetical protein
LIVGDISLAYLEHVYRRMALPEPLVYTWREDGVIAGLITGYIHQDQKLCHVEHMIVLPEAPRKFRVMMEMSRDCTRLLHERGFDVVLKILVNDPRTGLRAWAKYATDHEAEWYVHRAPKGNSNG